MIWIIALIVTWIIFGFITIILRRGYLIQYCIMHHRKYYPINLSGMIWLLLLGLVGCFVVVCSYPGFNQKFYIRIPDELEVASRKR